MTHFASEGFGFPGGVGDEEYAHLYGDAPSEGHIFHVISRPHFLPLPAPLSYTQYSTCFAHNLAQYVAQGWTDEGYEAVTEKECIDWINAKPDCSIDLVLERNPAIKRQLKRNKPADAEHKLHYDQQLDNRRGKYV